MTDTQTTNPDGWQVVFWFPEWRGFSFQRMEGIWKRFYVWSLNLGFIEIRKWS